MKKVIYLLIILICIQCAPKKALDTSKGSTIKTIIENENFNIVYRGIKNPLTIYMPDVDSTKVNGIGLHKIEKNKYYITPGLGTKLEITIVGYRNGNEIIDKREFRILDIQRPYASIHDNFGTVILSKKTLAYSKIKTHIPQFVIELPETKSFQYKINDQHPILNKGNTFNKTAKEQICNLKKGDSVLINNVKLKTDTPNTDRKAIIELKIYNQNLTIYDLITDFQDSAKEVVEILKKVYNVNDILEGWHSGKYKQTGEIPEEGLKFYACHGIGIAAHFSDKLIDFDFSYLPELRCDGFDLGRLTSFSKSQPKKYDSFLNEKQIEAQFEKLKKENLIYNPLTVGITHNYFWTDSLDEGLIKRDQTANVNLKKSRWKFW